MAAWRKQPSKPRDNSAAAFAGGPCVVTVFKKWAETSQVQKLNFVLVSGVDGMLIRWDR